MTDNTIVMCRGRYADSDTWVHACGYTSTCARYVGQTIVAPQVPVAEFFCSDAVPDQFLSVDTGTY